MLYISCVAGGSFSIYTEKLKEFLYRRGQLLNLAGEKTSEEAACHALSEAVKEWGCELVDFTTMTDYDSTPGRYTFFVEVKNPAALAGTPHYATVLEEALGRANPRYLAGRRSGRLGPLELQLVRAGTFGEIKKTLLARGASVNQVKIPRMICDEELAKLLKESVLTERRNV